MPLAARGRVVAGRHTPLLSARHQVIAEHLRGAQVDGRAADVLLPFPGAHHHAERQRHHHQLRDRGATAVATDGAGNVFVVGTTNGVLPGQTSAGLTDVFALKLDGSGNTVWLRQVGSSSDDLAYDAAADALGNVVFAGGTSGILPGQTSLGTNDGFFLRFSP